MAAVSLFLPPCRAGVERAGTHGSDDSIKRRVEKRIRLLVCLLHRVSCGLDLQRVEPGG